MRKILHKIKRQYLAIFAVLLCAILPLFLTGCSRQKVMDSFGDIVEEIKESVEEIKEQLELPSEPEENQVPFYNFASNTDSGGMITFNWQTDCELDGVEVAVTANDDTGYYLVEDNTWQLQLSPNMRYDFVFNVCQNGETVHMEECSRYYIPEINHHTNFPRMEIVTQNEIWPTCDYVSAPLGGVGASITNNDYVNATTVLYSQQNELLYDSTTGLTVDEMYSGAKLKIRGNTSAYAEKKPYKIKLNKKVDLLSELVDRESEIDYTNKEWLLLASGDLLNTMVGFSVSETLGMDWTPSYSYVELYVNGDYRGLYILCESVSRGSGKGDKQSRCAVDKDGFIIELDAYWWNEDLYFGTPYHNRPYKYTFKYPDADDIDENSEEYEYIKNVIDRFEVVLSQDDENVFDYIDVTSFAKWLLAHDILGTWDSGGANIYLTKKDSANSLLMMGPLWDFDTIFMQQNDFARIHNEHVFYYPDLLNRSEFTEVYRDTFDDVKDEIITDLQDKLSLLDSETYNQLLTINNARWNKSGRTLEQSIDVITNFFTEHLAWLDEQI
ncbi:MAG: CotH kinase family protein [Clostridia bacterium]|nr:CotH kinase family protein [Clostridia bacterium]